MEGRHQTVTSDPRRGEVALVTGAAKGIGKEIVRQLAAEGIRGAGHVSNLERPDELNRAAREFCRAHEQRGSWYG